MTLGPQPCFKGLFSMRLGATEGSTPCDSPCPCQAPSKCRWLSDGLYKHETRSCETKGSSAFSCLRGSQKLGGEASFVGPKFSHGLCQLIQQPLQLSLANVILHCAGESPSSLLFLLHTSPVIARSHWRCGKDGFRHFFLISQLSGQRLGASSILS